MTREEAIEWMDWLKMDVRERGYNDIVAALKMAIQALEQESRKGHWIIKEGREQGYDIGGIKTWYIQIMCSECGFIKTAIEGHTGQYHYCPNCGADIRGDE